MKCPVCRASIDTDDPSETRELVERLYTALARAAEDFPAAWFREDLQAAEKYLGVE